MEHSEQYKGAERRIDFNSSSQRAGNLTRQLVSHERIDENLLPNCLGSRQSTGTFLIPQDGFYKFEVRDV